MLHIIPMILLRKSIIGIIYLERTENYNGSVKQRKEDCVLRKLVEAVLEDLSTRDMFLFRVTCGNCGSAYGNKPIRFSKADTPATTKNKQIIHDALYEQEFRAAKQVAIRNAAEHMNYCPICKRLVCNQCFLICDDLDMCKHCAADLEQQGKPVLPVSFRQSV